LEHVEASVPDGDLDGRQVTLRVTKSGKTRAAFINDLAMHVFEAMRVSDRKRKKDRAALFSGVTPEQLSTRFIRACRDAGVKDRSFHDLRHTYASHLRMKGADLDDIRRPLGHSDLRMTIHYAHLLPEHLEGAASRLDGVLTLPEPIDKPATEKGSSEGEKGQEVRVLESPQRPQR
jgi:integrase